MGNYLIVIAGVALGAAALGVRWVLHVLADQYFDEGNMQ